MVYHTRVKALVCLSAGITLMSWEGLDAGCLTQQPPHCGANHWQHSVMRYGVEHCVKWFAGVRKSATCRCLAADEWQATCALGAQNHSVCIL